MMLLDDVKKIENEVTNQPEVDFLVKDSVLQCLYEIRIIRF